MFLKSSQEMCGIQMVLPGVLLIGNLHTSAKIVSLTDIISLQVLKSSYLAPSVSYPLVSFTDPFSLSFFTPADPLFPKTSWSFVSNHKTNCFPSYYYQGVAVLGFGGSCSSWSDEVTYFDFYTVAVCDCVFLLYDFLLSAVNISLTYISNMARPILTKLGHKYRVTTPFMSHDQIAARGHVGVTGVKKVIFTKNATPTDYVAR